MLARKRAVVSREIVRAVATGIWVYVRERWRFVDSGRSKCQGHASHYR
jgi:hypothetical protein